MGQHRSVRRQTLKMPKRSNLTLTLALHAPEMESPGYVTFMLNGKTFRLQNQLPVRIEAGELAYHGPTR